ncbi:MAG: precorrin-3B C(17)-methyltransferase [Lachnospiraceae bacterium]|nr:precorrin-3B C(17)-methyltransferase [Lachnospiraceae bacterium]
MKRIDIIGMGPGRESMMTGDAIKALDEADIIVGYKVYLDQLGERYSNKEMYDTPMRKERERCLYCFEKAKENRQVALICSGDAGVYGMASLMYEIGESYKDIELNVIPGITAALSGAAILGAPVNHDFCLISLSDVLTPWEKIEKRLKAAVEGDFVIVIYNPQSRSRKGYIGRAADIITQYGGGARVCGYVRNIGRDGMLSRICKISDLENEDIDMFTTVFIGNSDTKIVNGKMVTPRIVHER